MTLVRASGHSDPLAALRTADEHWIDLGLSPREEGRVGCAFSFYNLRMCTLENSLERNLLLTVYTQEIKQ